MRQEAAPEGMSPAQQWVLTDRGDKFVMKTKQKLEISGANASEGLKATKIEASGGDAEIIVFDDDGVQSSVDLEIARDDVDQSQEILANMQDTVSTASSEKMSDFSEVILQPSEGSK